MFEKILIAIGNSAESQLVLGSGLTLTEKLGAKVLLLHVMSPLTSTSFSPLVGGMFPIVNRPLAKVRDRSTEPIFVSVFNQSFIISK